MRFLPERSGSGASFELVQIRIGRRMTQDPSRDPLPRPQPIHRSRDSSIQSSGLCSKREAGYAKRHEEWERQRGISEQQAIERQKAENQGRKL